ncbi:type I polyketide synthase [Nostoc sp. FACHB-133]|uniref:type I polyketide synthase n=1 Tax=Nostoc sp. FACHB-133 TaxID=2692835 RepID=UPI00168394D1|nr:type I polyketide synthase [Nostoc sp. FACHB-133]MBD2522061.1 type I polyketide synthase [Nostoc sp. FACHB-133]
MSNNFNEKAIAIIGMSGRFPKANNLDEYWQNLKNGVECISFFSDEELTAEGVDASTLNDPKYVKASPMIDNVEYFDAGFFGYSPREAKLIDPQHRVFLECAWEALEDAGCDPENYESPIGFYAGASINTYILDCILSDRLRPKLDFESFLETFVGSDKDFLTSRVSYRLNLRGPSVTVQTACSTSLVAVHLACQGLLNGDCDMALAGAISVRVPHRAGYYYRGGGIVSPDGHCRAFDAEAGGTVFGSGGGIVVLKKLANALEDGDRIHAIIRATAINNDGALKTSYTAPGVIGQKNAIIDALSKAGISPETISYIEAHGTGTPIGDPIEIDALTQAFHTQTQKQGFCAMPAAGVAIGSVKPNIGHLDVASGMAGLIKLILALKHQQIPPSINFNQPNPRIDFASSPFYVNKKLSPWQTNQIPRRAGVTALGLGGTNAHAILEEAPTGDRVKHEDDGYYLLPISARSSEALKCLAKSYQDFLSNQGETLRDICYTASVRRCHHTHRLSLLARSRDELSQLLETYLHGELHSQITTGIQTPDRQHLPIFIFPGQGSQWLGMGRKLLQQEPVFKAAIVQCDEAIGQYTNWSLLEQLILDEADSRLTEIDVIQPTLFAVEIALAMLWQSWGIKPAAVVGHSMGEVAAAYIAGALNLDDAAKIICKRSQVIKRVSGQGAMAVVGLSLEQAQKVIVGYEDCVSVAVSNGPTSTVLSGDPKAIETILANLQAKNIFCRLVKVDVASHSPQMEPLQEELRQLLQEIQPQAATIPIYSTVTGKLIDGLDLDTTYWVKNLREPVLFSTAIQSLIGEGHEVFLEISPHPILTTAIEQGLQYSDRQGVVLPSLKRNEDELAVMLNSLGAMYTAGYPVNWRKLYPDGGNHIQLPTYPWQRQRYWLDRKIARKTPPPEETNKSALSEECTDLFYDLTWRSKPQQNSTSKNSQDSLWLIFGDTQGLGIALASQLQAQGATCHFVIPGNSYSQSSQGYFTINPSDPEDLQQLIKDAKANSQLPLRGIVHLWSLDIASAQVTETSLQDAEKLLCGSVLHLVQALVKNPASDWPHLWLVTQNTQPVKSSLNSQALPQSLLWGMGRVIALEHPELWGGLIDLDKTTADQAAMLLAEIQTADGEDQISWRDGQRYVARLVTSTVPKALKPLTEFNADGTYLITGGLGGLGLKLAAWLVAKGARHLVLTGRQGLPERSLWDTLPPDDKHKKAITAIQTLEAQGATVKVVQADVSNFRQMQAVFASNTHWRGIIHAAGISIPQNLAEMSLSTYQNVLAAKVSGTWILHQLTQNLQLDFLILFSSAAAIWGSSGLAPYASANHFLDILAHYRQGNNLPALSVNWGSWDEINVVAAEIQSLWSRVGLKPMAVTQTLEALKLCLQSGVVQKTVADVDWSIFKPTYEVRRHRPLLEELGQPQKKQENNAVIKSELLLQLEKSLAGDRHNLLITHLQMIVSEILDLDPENPPENQQGFFQMGMDSLMSIQLKNRLEASLNHPLPSTLAFDYPNIEMLANYLTQEVLAPIFHQHLETTQDISTQPTSQNQSNSLDELFLQIESLSEDAVTQLFLN